VVPASATPPPSIPDTIRVVNLELEKLGLAARVTEILSGVRRHVTVVLNTAVDDITRKVVLREVYDNFDTEAEHVHVLERSTHSILKFTAVPTVTPDGIRLDEERLTESLLQHPQWQSVDFVGAPRFIRPKKNPDPYLATVQIKIRDTQKASVAKRLLQTSVTFVGATRKCQEWTVSTTARQCSTCLKWGHTAYGCRSRVPQCNVCAGPHLSAFHRSHASSCRDHSCKHYQITCSNCADSHEATSVSCPFFKAWSSPGQLQTLQKARVERLRRRL
jgi:hypothetical protein